MPSAEERKLVTVLFADLAGSTELAVTRDPEQFRALLSAFFDEMAAQIRAFGTAPGMLRGRRGEPPSWMSASTV